MMGTLEQSARFGGSENRIENCGFKSQREIELLAYREYPYWHVLLSGRHIGVHRPDDRICNWTARILKSDGSYRQKCLGPALDLTKRSIDFKTAIGRAFEWFETGEVKALASIAQTRGRAQQLSVCPIGPIYTVGHALSDYIEWSRVARSAGGHYNNLVLMNYHLVPSLSSIPIEEFCGKDLQRLAVQVLETRPKRGFEQPAENVSIDSLNAEEVRKRKRTFNSLVTIMRMAFRYAWENGHLQSERSWKCLNRVSVNHCPRTIFLTRDECHRLLEACTPALKNLVLAGLYSGCRVGELGNLRVEDVANHGYGLTIRAYKRSPTRFVFLPDEGMAFFLECCEGKLPSDQVLLSFKGKPWKRQHTLHFRTAVAKAGLPREFVFHGLRHTYASDLIRAGATLDTVAKQLGHAGTLTVANTYGHLAAHFREDQVRRLFSPLSEIHQKLALKHKDKLENIWTSAQPSEWRDYSIVDDNTSLPTKSMSRPHPLVLNAFGRANGRH